MEFIKNNWYNCLHDCIIKKECVFSRGCIYKCIESNVLKGNNDESINLNDFDINWDCYFSFAVIPTDNVNHSIERVEHPKHYSYLKELCGIEVIDITRHLDFDLGNVIKYVLRQGFKSEEGMSNKEKAIEDLKKARWYLDDKIKMLEKKL